MSVTPRLRITAERDRRGAGPLTADCVALLEGRPDEVSDALIVALGGVAARLRFDRPARAARLALPGWPLARWPVFLAAAARSLQCSTQLTALAGVSVSK